MFHLIHANLHRVVRIPSVEKSEKLLLVLAYQNLLVHLLIADLNVSVTVNVLTIWLV